MSSAAFSGEVVEEQLKELSGEREEGAKGEGQRVRGRLLRGWAFVVWPARDVEVEAGWLRWKFPAVHMRAWALYYDL